MSDNGRHGVLGITVDAVDYDAATAAIIAASEAGRPMAVTALAVHGLMTGVKDRAFGARLNSFDLVTPDGQPVRWAMNLLHNSGLTDRVYGPELTLRVVTECARRELPVYVYGSSAETLERLLPALEAAAPGLKIAGAEPSGFRQIASAELAPIADRIRESHARVVLVGLGCPRQELFVHAMRGLLEVPLLAVGAAFDYHAGQLRRPPRWMQRRGLEWVWRFGLEPRRLWRRYVLLNPAYLLRLAGQRLGLYRPRAPVPDVRPAAQIPV